MAVRARGETMGENARQVFRWNADAVVLHPDHDAFPIRFGDGDDEPLFILGTFIQRILGVADKLIRIWRTLCLSTIRSGTSPNRRMTLTPWRVNAAELIWMAS